MASFSHFHHLLWLICVVWSTSSFVSRVFRSGSLLHDGPMPLLVISPFFWSYTYLVLPKQMSCCLLCPIERGNAVYPASRRRMDGRSAVEMGQCAAIARQRNTLFSGTLQKTGLRGAASLPTCHQMLPTG